MVTISGVRGPRRGRNRRHGPPLWARLPGPAATGRAAWRTLRAGAPVLAVVGAVAAAGGGLYLGYRWLTGSERFAVAGVDIEGNRMVSADRILEQLGAVEGENIFRLDLRALERTLERDPWIADAVVDRRLPDRLEVHIQERTAAALVELGGLYLADPDGQPFKRADVAAGEGVGLPLITGLRRDDLRQAPDAFAGRVREALELAAAYTADARRPALGEIHFHPRAGAVLRTRDSGLSIRLGHLTGEAAAARLLAFDAAWAALDDEERSGARAVHLDSRTRPDRITIAFEAQPPTQPSSGKPGQGSGG